MAEQGRRSYNMHTTDGHTISTLEQEGKYAGEDVGRIHIHVGHIWYWYGDIASPEERQVLLEKAQSMTAKEFDKYFDDYK